MIDTSNSFDIINPSAEDTDFLCKYGPLLCAKDLTVSSAEHRNGAFLLEGNMPTGVYERTEEQLKNARENHPRGENHPSWKGDEVSVGALHSWLRRNFGTPSKCVECGITTAKRFEWANISGKYKRDIKDFKRLCSKCHALFDKELRPRGERQGISILTDDKVRKIFRLWKTKKYTQKEIGKKFGVKRPTITSIINKRNWRHINAS